MRALLVVNCFPPLLKNAGGVSKRYLTLVRALIDGLGWQVTLLTPVDVRAGAEKDVLRWLDEGTLEHLPARGVRIESKHDGVAVFCDLASGVNAGWLLQELLLKRRHDVVIMDDLGFRFELMLLCRAMGVPTIVSTHTDITHMPSCKGVVKQVWNCHVASSYLASVHTTVSRVFGDQMSKKYGVPVGAIWPPILWSPDFRSDPAGWKQRGEEQRKEWFESLRGQGCDTGSLKAILLSVGRWSAEKRMHLLIDALPDDCALIICGDGTSEYATMLEDSGAAAGRKNVLPLRRMLGSTELRLAYTAADLTVSASNFETLGNTIVESLCSGTPVAVQPAQGHLEFVKNDLNSWFVEYESAPEAKARLSEIVTAGLDQKSLEARLPKFRELSDHLRQADFATEFDTEVLQKALAVGEQQTLGPSGQANTFVELTKRMICAVLCFSMWFVLRFVTRITYVTSTDPKFAILAKLGQCLDGGEGPTDAVSILPIEWYRRWWRDGDKPGPHSVMPSDAKDTSDTSDITEYGAHFQPAFDRATGKWFQAWHEVILLICFAGLLCYGLSGSDGAGRPL
jgi:glycosyltransferase involved in cell wall biosynthesis